MIDIQKFKEQGYLIIPKCIPKDDIDKCKDVCLSIKHLVVDNNLEGTKKSFGVKKYWKGMDMASFLSADLFRYYFRARKIIPVIVICRSSFRAVSIIKRKILKKIQNSF